jgi:hypothetical protein
MGNWVIGRVEPRIRLIQWDGSIVRTTRLVRVDRCLAATAIERESLLPRPARPDGRVSGRLRLPNPIIPIPDGCAAEE